MLYFREVYHSIIDSALDGGKYKHHFHVFHSECCFVVVTRYYVGSPKHYKCESVTYTTFASVRRKRIAVESMSKHVFVALDKLEEFKS